MSQASFDRSSAALPPAHELAQTRNRAFRDARRHSRRVRFLRIALPVAALGGALLVLLVYWLDPLRLYRNLPVEFGRISIADNKLTIEAPKLTGFTQDRRPYWVTAQSAAQNLKQPNLIELTGIKGQVGLADRGESEMRAASGLFDMKTEQLRLEGGIEIEATGGYQIRLDDAFIEVRKGHVVTDKPVNAVFPDGTLQANRLEIFDHGAHVVFDGGVAMTLRLPPPNESQTAETRR